MYFFLPIENPINALSPSDCRKKNLLHLHKQQLAVNENVIQND